MSERRQDLTPTLVERAARRAIDGLAPNGDETRARLIDAAYDEFCRVGIAKASMDGVAKRAGTSRITIYRKFESKDALVDEVIAREFSRYLADFRQSIVGAHTIADRVIAGFVTSLQQVAGNPLIKRMIDDDPTVVPGLIGGGDGRNLVAVGEFVSAGLREEQAAGNLDPALDPTLTGEMIVRISGSFLTTPSRLVDLADGEQIAAIARTYLLPMLRIVET